MGSVPIGRVGDIYPHFTCLTDTKNVKHTFAEIKNHVLQRHLQEVIGGGLWP